MRVGMKLHGAKELEAALRALPDRLTKGVVERVLVKVGAPIADAYRANVRVRSGRLQAGIGISTRLSKRQRKGRAKSKTLSEAFVGAGPSRHAHLEEFGTGPRYTESGRYTGQMPPGGSLRAAWEGGKEKALDEIGELLWQEIEKTAKRLGRKAAKFRR